MGILSIVLAATAVALWFAVNPWVGVAALVVAFAASTRMRGLR